MQIMHVGLCSHEPATIELMETFAEENGFVRYGKHMRSIWGIHGAPNPRTIKPSCGIQQ